jgi:hypothetical protein
VRLLTAQARRRPAAPARGCCRMTSEGSQDWRSPVADQRSPGQCSEFLPKRRLGGLGTSKRALQVRRGHIPCLSGVHPAREPGRDLLDQPRVAVGIGEVEERAVAGGLGSGPGCRASNGNGRPCQMSLTSIPRSTSSSWAASMSETMSPPSAEPGAAVGSPWPNVTEAPEPGGELDDAKAGQRRGVVVEPPRPSPATWVSSAPRPRHLATGRRPAQVTGQEAGRGGEVR